MLISKFFPTSQAWNLRNKQPSDQPNELPEYCKHFAGSVPFVRYTLFVLTFSSCEFSFLSLILLTVEIHHSNTALDLLNL